MDTTHIIDVPPLARLAFGGLWYNGPRGSEPDIVYLPVLWCHTNFRLFHPQFPREAVLRRGRAVEEDLLAHGGSQQCSAGNRRDISA
jgi:hypothetical protein